LGELNKDKGLFKEIRKRARWLIPVLALFFINIIFFYDVIFGDYLLVERDLSVFFIPPKFFWLESIKNGEFPLWNPYNLFGIPFFAALQPAILYPLNLMFFILPFSIAFNWSIILHIFLGGAFLYALLRDMDANEWASFIGAFSFMLGGYMLSVHNLLSTLVSVVWVPLIMLFFRRSVRDGSIKYAIITGMLLTVSFLGGGIEAVVGCLIALSVMVIFSPIIGGKGRLKAAMNIGISVIIFLGLSAVQIIPFLELSRYSIRGEGITYQEATIWSLALRDIISFFLTDPYDYYKSTERYWANQSWLKTLYTGFLPFIFMIFYFIKGGRERILWLSIIVISLFLALGGFNPLYYYLYSYAPFFNKLRYPVKFLYLAILAISITAGLGMHLLMEKEKDRVKTYFINAVFISGFIAVFFLLFLVLGHSYIESFLKAKGIDSPDYKSVGINLYNAKRALFYLTMYCVFLKIGEGIRWKYAGLALLCIALTGDLFGNIDYYQRMKTEDYFKPSWAIEKITSDKDNFRILATPKTTDQTTFIAPDIKPFDSYKQLFAPSMNLIHNVYDVRGAEVMRVKRIEDVCNAFISGPSIDATNLAGLFNIKYVVSLFPIKSKEFKLIAAHTEGLEGDYDELIEDKTIKIYKNLKFMPRAFLAEDFKVLKNDVEILTAMKSKYFEPDKMVILEEEPVWDSISAAQNEKKNVRIAEGGNNHLMIKAATPKKSILVLTDTYFPGWKAFVNGKEQKIYRADNAFRAVLLNAGSYEVKFVYDPVSFRAGLAITIFTLILISVLVIIYFVYPYFLSDSSCNKIYNIGDIENADINCNTSIQ